MSKGLGVLATLCYPFLVYAVIDRIEPRYLGLGLMLLFLLRWRYREVGRVVVRPTAFLVAGGVFFLAVSLFNNAVLLLAYPVFVNAVFLAVFAYSVLNPPTVAERVARLQDPDLPPRAVEYTRKVTLVWCGFFVVNGLISAGTLWLGNMSVWSLYNGLIAYILMGLLMGAELLVRRQVRKSL
jgi:uncharacterized membrane protein